MSCSGNMIPKQSRCCLLLKELSFLDVSTIAPHISSLPRPLPWCSGHGFASSDPGNDDRGGFVFYEREGKFFRSLPKEKRKHMSWECLLKICQSVSFLLSWHHKIDCHKPTSLRTERGLMGVFLGECWECQRLTCLRTELIDLPV